MDKIYRLLQEIKVQPEQHIARKSLNDLYFYLLGYARREVELTGVYPDFFDRFRNFIRKKYNILSESLGWVEVISFFSLSEEEAFDNFYVNLEEFINI